MDINPTHRRSLDGTQRLRPSKPSWVLRAAGLVRAACSPMNLALGGGVAFGWLILVAWTGAGPDSWQARVCSNLDVRPAACSSVHKKDESRIAPYAITTRAPT